MSVELHRVPEFWLGYLFNCEQGGLSDREVAQIEAFLAHHNLGEALDTNSGSEFFHSHAASDFGVLACDCVLVTFPVKDLK